MCLKTDACKNPLGDEPNGRISEFRNLGWYILFILFSLR